MYKLAILPCAAAAVVVYAVFKRFILSAEYFYDRVKKYFSNRVRDVNYELQNVKLASSNSIQADLINGTTKEKYKFRLTVREGAVHLFINSLSKPKYILKDVVNKSKPNVENVIIQENQHLIIIRYRTYVVFIAKKPLLISIHSNMKQIVELNGYNGLVLENSEPHMAVGLDINFPNTNRFYGLPQRASKLSLNEQSYRLFNRDTPNYPANSPKPLYGSIPVLYSYSPFATVGLFWCNSSETMVDFNYCKLSKKVVYFCSESGALNLSVLLGPTLQDCVMQYSNITGTTPMPPMFSLGYHHSCKNYEREEQIVDAFEKFEHYLFPIDSIWLNITYTLNQQYFTWSNDRFHTYYDMLRYLERRGKHIVVMLGPHMKAEDNCFVYRNCKRSYLVKDARGNNYHGDTCVGKSAWFDFLNPEATNYYTELVKTFTCENDNLHMWIDMNEPAVCDVEDNTMPKNLIHFGNVKHRDIHNQYGLLQAKATYEGISDRETRPFVVTRSHFAGIQRYAAVYSGDCSTSWEHLRQSVPMCLTQSLAGVSLNGSTIGGFTANVKDEELIVRWFQLGAWLPLFWSHADDTVNDPYFLTESSIHYIRIALRTRYRYLPYWYTQFFVHFISGEPVVRPTVYHYSSERNWDSSDQFMVGRDIFVHPILEKGSSEMRRFYLPGPGEVWYFGDANYKRFNGGRSITVKPALYCVPVFFRGGSIIPIKESVKLCSSHFREEALTLQVFLNEDEEAEGFYYNDDNVTLNYQQNEFSVIKLTFNNYTITSDTLGTTGHGYVEELFAIQFIGLKNTIKTVKLNPPNQIKVCKPNIITKDGYVAVQNLNIDVTKNFQVTLLLGEEMQEMEQKRIDAEQVQDEPLREEQQQIQEQDYQVEARCEFQLEPSSQQVDQTILQVIAQIEQLEERQREDVEQADHQNEFQLEANSQNVDQTILQVIAQIEQLGERRREDVEQADQQNEEQGEQCSQEGQSSQEEQESHEEQDSLEEQSSEKEAHGSQKEEQDSLEEQGSQNEVHGSQKEEQESEEDKQDSLEEQNRQQYKTEKQKYNEGSHEQVEQEQSEQEKQGEKQKLPTEDDDED